MYIITDSNPTFRGEDMKKVENGWLNISLHTILIEVEKHDLYLPPGWVLCKAAEGYYMIPYEEEVK